MKDYRSDSVTTFEPTERIDILSKKKETKGGPMNVEEGTDPPFFDLNRPALQWGMMIFLSFIWGTSFILMKKGLESYTYTQVAAFRIFFSFVFLIPFVIKHFKKLQLKNLKSLIIVGLVGTAIPAFLFTKSQTQINSSLAGMLNSLTPMFTLVIGLFIFKQIPKRRNALGVAIGLVGAVGLMFKGEAGVFDEINIYALFVVLATICYGTSLNEVKYRLAKMGGIAITALSFFLVGPIAGVYLLFSDYSSALATPNYILNLGYIGMLALFSSAIALVLFNTLIKYTTALFASSVTYIIPIFAIFWGILDGEAITLPQLLWIGVILVGVYLVNKK